MAGNIREVRPGSWEIRVNAGYDAVTGKRRQISRTIKGSKRDAEKALTALLSENDRGKLASTNATFKFLAEEWLKLAREDLSPTTLQRYEVLLKKHIYPAIGDLTLRKIKTFNLDRLYSGLHNQVGLSPATVRQVHAIIRRAFRQGMMWGWIGENPAANATPPRMSKPDLSPPNAAEVGELIRAASEFDPEFGHFLFLSATTGARRGEMCALRWHDVDLNAATVSIERSIIELRGGGIMEKDTKTHSSRRIALDEFSQTVLVTQHHLVTARAAIVGLSISSDAYIFSREPDGSTPWLPNWVTQSFIGIRDGLGYERMRLHDLRHFAATSLIAAGVPVRTVSGRLGHANPATTLMVYSHFVEASDQEAARIMGTLVAPVKSKAAAITHSTVFRSRTRRPTQDRGS